MRGPEAREAPMSRKTVVWIACALVTLVLGCSTTSQRTVSEAARDPGTAIHGKKGQRITGYVTTDGTHHELEGYVRVVSPDTLEFSVPPLRATYDRSMVKVPPFRVPLDSVQTVFVRHTRTAETILLTVGVLAGVALAVVAVALATKESCPFLYSWDGDQYVFDGEPYGGATMRSLERTDWSELEHLVPAGGEYRMLIANEVDETQHTNRISLLAVDHEPGTTVVMDYEGRPHAFRRLVPLAAAGDATGADLLPWLQERDLVAWYPDLKSLASSDSLADTRSHITLEFPRPAGVSRAWLLADVATGQWGSHRIRSMLGMRGSRVDEFYAAINSDPRAREALHAWNEREELFVLHPELEREGRWERVGTLLGGGPFLSEWRAIPIDLSGVQGDTLRLRLHPPIGFWSLNSFHLAWEESEARVRELEPVRARGDGGVDVLGTLLEQDDRYLDFPRTGDRAEVIFPAPEPAPGLDRTVFARTAGWYEIHLYSRGAPPDSAGLERLTREPGYAVRSALREYAEFRRSGVLAGTRGAAEGAR